MKGETASRRRAKEEGRKSVILKCRFVRWEAVQFYRGKAPFNMV